ncbi:MAG: M20/M25/M40 family metallo-hydrolase [Bacteroidales bacterium]|nr:M20/M25/M40 family metallo-hydrolase [Bacteroidales bacterium]
MPFWHTAGMGRVLALGIGIGMAGAVSGAVSGAERAPAPRLLTASQAAEHLDQAVLTEVHTRSGIMKNLQYLSDVIGPRLTGSRNLEQANHWAAQRMRSYGLENVRLEPWELPIGWERISAHARLVEPNNGRTLLLAAAGWSPGTNGTVTGPIVVLKARTTAELAQYKGKLKGVIVLRGEPTTIAPVTDLTYGPPRSSASASASTPKTGNAPAKLPQPSLTELRAFRRELSDFLKAEGALALFIDAAKPHGLLITTGSWRTGDRGTPQEPMPTLYVAHEHYRLLYRLATAPEGTPPRVELTVVNRFQPGPITVYNTVGEIRGSEKPDEYVVLGAHLDSWDLASGTTDNGTGSCVVLEVARALAQLTRAGFRPKRTIRFVLFSGEEQGLHGSKQYVKRHQDEMPRTSAALVHDTGTGQVQGLNLQGRAAVRAVLTPELRILSTIPGWKGLELTSMGGTDHLSFEAAGVPGFACKQDMDEYRLTHHTQSDTFDKAKEPNLIQGAQVLALTVLRIANLPELLPREKPQPAKKDPAKKEPAKKAG